jgi:glycosyltransferase involved in cell wall biosynthesis
LRVAHVSCFHDPARRKPAALLEAWPTLVDVATAVARAGVHVTVMQAANENAEIKREGIRFMFVADTPPTWLGRRLGPLGMPLPRRMAERLRALTPDIIHLQGLAFPGHTRYIGRRVPGARILVQDHADHPPHQVWRGLWRQGLSRINAVAFTAAEQAMPFVASGVLRPDLRVFEIPESSTRFRPGEPDTARRETGLHGDPCLLWLGRLDANKDPLCILDALSRTTRELPDVQLWMCYRDAPLLAEVKSRIAADPTLASRVHLLGKQTHARVEQLLRAADFLVQGSHIEGSGYSVIEALACGTTPLVTDIPSFRMLLARGRYGALSPVGDAAAMAKAWIEWARRDRADMRTQTTAYFERELSFDALGKRLRAAYDELMKA